MVYASQGPLSSVVSAPGWWCQNVSNGIQGQHGLTYVQLLLSLFLKVGAVAVTIHQAEYTWQILPVQQDRPGARQQESKIPWGVLPHCQWRNILLRPPEALCLCNYYLGRTCSHCLLAMPYNPTALGSRVQQVSKESGMQQGCIQLLDLLGHSKRAWLCMRSTQHCPALFLVWLCKNVDARAC